jgi:hypothetical protein
MNNSYNVMNIDYLLIFILKYLDVNDLIKSRYTSKTFNKVITTPNLNLFTNFELCFPDDKDYSLLQPFFHSIITTNTIHKLNLLLCENLSLAHYILSLINPLSLTELKIPLSILHTKNDLLPYTSLTSLSIKNMYFNECGMPQNILLLSNIMNMHTLTKLKLNNIKYINAEFINYLQCDLTYLDLRDCMEFKIEDFEDYLLKHVDTLRTLKLDGENSNLEELITIIPNMNVLSELTVSYCENLSDRFLDMIVLISFQLKKLTLRKLRGVSKECFERFFKDANFENLEKLDFYDAARLGNEAACYIAKNKKLKYVDLSWTEMIRNCAVVNILKNCKLLEYLLLQGCKLLDENMLECFFEDDNNNDYKFTNLKKIDLTKCDLIVDKDIMKVIYKYNWITIINYYGRDMRDPE